MSNIHAKVALAVCTIAVLLPASVVAAEDVPRRLEHLEHQIDDLTATVSYLQNRVSTLQTQLATIQSNHALLLDPFVRLDPNPEAGVIGPNIVFGGANIHIVSGSGATNDNDNPTGLGNLIIGYDEVPEKEGMPNGPPPGFRSGVHNLVIGPFNTFTKAVYGGLVTGEDNEISSPGSAVLGGTDNIADGPWSVVIGGNYNEAAASYDIVVGGDSNLSSGGVSEGGINVIVGGNRNIAVGALDVIIGSYELEDTAHTELAILPAIPGAKPSQYYP